MPAAKRAMRLYNLHEHARVRVELPTGKTVQKNQQAIPVLDVFWLIGSRDSDEEQVNFIELTAEQFKYVQSDPAIQDWIAKGRLSLVA